MPISICATFYLDRGTYRRRRWYDFARRDFVQNSGLSGSKASQSAFAQMSGTVVSRLILYPQHPDLR